MKRLARAASATPLAAAKPPRPLEYSSASSQGDSPPSPGDDAVAPGVSVASSALGAASASATAVSVAAPWVAELHKHFTELQQQKRGLYEEFLEMQSKSNARVDQSRVTQSPAIVQDKNRYSNVLTFNDTRVRLGRGAGNDYINASLVRGGRSSYILAQAPLDHTIEDFWTMAWEQNVPIIVMLTSFWDGSTPKSSVYLPLRPGEAKVYGAFQVECESAHVDHEAMTRSVLRLSKRGVEASRSIVHVRMDSWPDFGAVAGLRPVIALVREMQREVASKGGVPIVHCSAGIGRSGTFVAIAEAIDGQLPQGKASERVPALVAKLRAQRMGCVQTVHQYQMIYEAVLCEFQIAS